ncbi:hypothetical protein P0D71_17600 [Paraburkholderia sp. RL17-383-BIF-A]|uniref:hypothetical protein n=1 Tax=Paraburkholderia sp. RL17-383-BIF-A TaxID=3031631 RepID=UPI0038BB3FE7
MPSHCYWSVCFFHLSKDVPKFFGFAEYLAAVALMALAWTIADVRYKFRVATAPIPLQITTYSVVGAVGLLTLVTDLWRAKQWLVPEGWLSSAGWQALLGLIFLANFMVWVWYAFIKPPTYSRWNAFRFAREVYRAVLRSSPTELPEVADELARSARAIVKHAWLRHEAQTASQMAPRYQQKPSREFLARDCAHEILLIIADKRFCRHVVVSAPVIATELFDEVRAQNRHHIALGTFAKNFTAAAIANKDSFAFHETNGYYTGFFGHQKPITRAIYEDYPLVTSLREVFNMDFEEQRRWDSAQWEAFCRLNLVTIESAISSGVGSSYDPIIGGAFNHVERSVNSLYKLNGKPTDAWDDDELRKLRIAVTFVMDVVKILNKHFDKTFIVPRRAKSDHSKDVCDMIAGLMFELISSASAIKEPRELCWLVQRNYVWNEFFGKFEADGPAVEMVRFKLRRLLLKEITGHWNYQSSRILGLMLNVMGLIVHGNEFTAPTNSLHRAVIRWTVKNYARLATQMPTVSENVLVDRMTYDPEGPSLIFTREPLLDHRVSPNVLKLRPFIEDV